MTRPDSVLIASRAATSLPSALERHEHRCRGGRRDELREDLGLRDDEVLEHLRGLDAVDLGGAELRERLLGGVEAGADEDGRRLAQTAGDRQQLGRGLADLAVDMVDEHENFRH